MPKMNEKNDGKIKRYMRAVCTVSIKFSEK
jgi:hypothetical protein